MRRTMWMAALVAAMLASATAAMAQGERPADPPDPPDAPGMAHHHPGMDTMDRPGGRWGMEGRRAWRMHGPGGRFGMGFLHGPWLMHQLDLTETQRTKASELHDRASKRQIQAMADVRIAEVDLRRLAHAERPDQRAIDAQIDRIATLRAGITKAHVATLFEFRALLTPEQQKKLHDLREMGPPGGPHGPGMGRGGDDDGEDEGGDDGGVEGSL